MGQEGDVGTRERELLCFKLGYRPYWKAYGNDDIDDEGEGITIVGMRV